MQREKKEKNQTKKKQKENISKNKKDNLCKKEKGITLIALVVTIIVLLILAGVTIATLVGDNGILTKANEAVQTNTKAEEKEKISLAWQSLYLKKRQTDGTLSEITAEELEEQLIADGVDEDTVSATGSRTITVTFTHPEGNNAYTIDQDGNVAIKEPSKWYAIVKEDRTVITDGEKELYIGDYVDYDEQVVGIEPYISYQTKNGFGDQTYNLDKNDMEWRVLGLNEETGEILLLADNVIYATDSTDGDTDQAYRLSGQAGYQYGVDELNNICEIFGHGNGATGARSIEVADINKITGYEPDTAKYYENYGVGYGKEITYYWGQDGNLYYEVDGEAKICSRDYSNGFFWYNEDTKEWNKSIKPETITNKEIIIKLKNNYYFYDARSLTGHGSNPINKKPLSISSSEYKMLFANISEYWIASTTINGSGYGGIKGDAYFGLRYANRWSVISIKNLSDILGTTYTSAATIRPVVSLRSDINITGGDGTQGEGAYTIQ